VRLTLKLMGIALVGVLAAPALASVVRDLGAEPARYDVLSINGPGATACTASQCGLLEQKSAADALAMAAGAGPATPTDRPSVVPDSGRNGLAGASGGTFSTTGPKQSSDVDPVLFTVIAPSRVAQGQLCMEEGNLLGFAPTCARPAPSMNSSFGFNCPNGVGYDRFGMKFSCIGAGNDPEPCPNGRGYDRFGLKIVCRPPGDAPEPGTLVLLGIGFLGLAVARARTIRRKASVAPL
jgi:PEP-CTERM motif-containing protein